MSNSGARFHIPFPTAFLSLNTPTKQSTNVNNGELVTSPESERAPHSFLSNRPTEVPRHASISSVSSVGSTSYTSAPSSPPTKVADSPVLKSTFPAFLALNSKYATPPASAKEINGGDKNSPFLSNRA